MAAKGQKLAHKARGRPQGWWGWGACAWSTT